MQNFNNYNPYNQYPYNAYPNTNMQPQQNYICCYKYLLDNVYDLKRVEEVKGMTVEEFANYFPIGIFIVRVEGHLTCVINNNIMDIWDCRDKIVDLVWEVK